MFYQVRQQQKGKGRGGYELVAESRRSLGAHLYLLEPMTLYFGRYYAGAGQWAHERGKRPAYMSTFSRTEALKGQAYRKMGLRERAVHSMAVLECVAWAAVVTATVFGFEKNTSTLTS
jgi:hypothetical protein